MKITKFLPLPTAGSMKVAGTLAAALLVLAGCSGGTPTSENPQTQVQGASTDKYPANAPPPATADVQSFKINVWDNLAGADRCGTCHKDNQTPRFVRADDINIAYQEANSVVDLANPGVSRMVAKVRGGHHCWTNDNNVCGDTLVRWITNWASATQGGTGKQIVLNAPTLADPGPSRIMPANGTATGNNGTSFASTIYTPYLKPYCANCHSSKATTPQQPYFADDDVNVAFEQARTKMNLDAPEKSRFVLRLGTESHNCWAVNGAVNCAADATAMETAIRNFAAGIAVTPIPTKWVTSKALGMYSGTIASGGSRYDNNAIAIYEFKEGTGAIAHDTSGVNPALDLQLYNTGTGASGFQWVGGWGIQFTGGKAQGFTNTSTKLRSLVSATGEYSIEAWAAPGNVAQEESRIVSFSGGPDTRYFTMGQSLYNYEFYARTSKTDANGMPLLATRDAAKVLQATLQHVVMTYDPINGRRIYVNGVYTGTGDTSGTSLGNWQDDLVLVMGNEVSNTKPWLGTLKFVAVHNRALTLPQVKQNFDAGVGEKYFVLFSVSHLVNVPQAYVMFEVSIYDSYAYLFNHAAFISLDPNAKPGSIVVKGMRIGINGTEPAVGQAYKTLNTTITDSAYTAIGGASLSNVGTIIASERGATADEFFLTFEQFGSNTDVRVEAAPTAPPPPPSVARPSDLGVRTFDAINDTFAKITGVDKNTAGVKATFTTVKQQLPAETTMQAFLASHQIGIAQLAISYCGAMVDTPALRTAFFGGASTSSPLQSTLDIDAVVNPIVDKVAGLTLSNQPSAAMKSQLTSLINNTDPNKALGLCAGSNVCGGTRTATVMKAACAAGLGSAVTLVQ